jgi:hypothetical protein
VVRNLILKQGIKRYVLGIVVFLITLLLLSSPYLSWVYKQRGGFHITTKLSALITFGDASAPSEEESDKNTQIFLREYFGKFLGTFIYTAKCLFKSFHWVLMLLLIIYIVFFARHARVTVYSMYILSFAILYIVGIIYAGVRGSIIGDRYLLVPTVLLFPWVVQGLIKGTDFVSKKEVVLKWMIVLTIIVMLPPLLPPERYRELGFKEAGIWLKTNVGSCKKIATRCSPTGYYADTKNVFPLAFTYERILKDCRTHKIDFVLFSEKDLEKRKGLLEGVRNSRDFKFIQSFPKEDRHGIYRVFLFEFEGKGK